MKKFIHQQPSMHAITSKNKQSRQQQNTQIQCRICLSDECQTGNTFINPCACKGSIKYAHLNCLSAWILKLQSSMEYRKNKVIACELCKYKIEYGKSQSSACCSKEEYLVKIQNSKVLFTTLVTTISIMMITLIVQTYFLQQKVVNRKEGQAFFQIVVITLFLTLSLCLQTALVTILVSSYFIKKMIQVTSIQQSKIDLPESHQTFDNLKAQTYYSFSFI